MEIELRGLKEGINRLRSSVSAESLDLEGSDLHCTSEIEADLTLTKNEPIYSIKGSLSASARLLCARCLTEFETELRAPFERIMHRKEKVALIEGASDEITFIPPEAIFVDLSAEVREALLLTLPIKPLCSEDCLGLCPTCGKNLNEEKCSCQHERTDVRWNMLLALKNQAED
ncbi:MAG: DUF177 domain-containing protein [Candidatus Latescibacteria bacterium]|nr:DUF177 domain-containing protein [Candidatus Latescibacterota bacterium]